MTKIKNTKRALLASALSLLLCVSMLVGTTYAWFTDSVVSANNIIKSGNLDVVLEYKTNWSDDWQTVENNSAIFKENVLYEPGYTEVVYLRISNAGTLALKYNLKVAIASETGSTNVNGDAFKLSDYLQIGSYCQDEYSGAFNYADILMPAMFGTRAAALSNVTGLAKLSEANSIIKSDAPILAGDKTAQVVALVLTMPESVGNEANYAAGYNAPEINLGITLLATQYTSEQDSFGWDYDENAEYPVTTEPWDGTADVSWYNDTDTTFTLSTAEQLAGLALITGTVDDFKGKTIILDSDIDLGLKDGEQSLFGDSFAPIGSTGERDGRGRLITEPFKGTFDGGGHTISNLYQSGWDFGYEWGQYGSLGLFSELESATVKNVVLEGFEGQVEGGDISFVAGSATGDCTFENIEIKNGSIGTYNNGIGGIIGWSGAGTYNFKDITIGEDVVIGGLWGSFDSSIGGVVGQGEPGATYNFENVDIACRLDAYNDCTASYDYYNYRMSGMIIGRLEETTTIDGANYPDMSKYNITCTNVTVTYGDWANYHYCRAAGARAIRVEAGYAYGGIAADYDHSVCTVHHMELIKFDQLFGGDQYAVKGLKEYAGVTVNYNN